MTEWFQTIVSVIVGAFLVILVMKLFGDDDDGRCG